MADSYVEDLPPDADPDRYLRDKDNNGIDLTKCLTLLDIFELNLLQSRVVVLSACETGLSGIEGSSDEYVGLPSGFLFAGTPSVISTFWAVDDVATSLLMMRLYQNLKQTNDVPIALKQAQEWLRQVTLGELLEISRGWESRHLLYIKRIERKYKKDERPFTSPYYWGAFYAVGL